MRRLKHHCKRLKTFGTTPEYLFRDQGVGGSNPLSPTISFQILAKSPGQRGLPKGLTFRVAGTGCAKNSRHTVAAAMLTASTLSSPCAIVDILGHVCVGVSHIVPRYFRPDANAAHQAGVHGAKAPEIGGSGQSKLLD